MPSQAIIAKREIFRMQQELRQQVFYSGLLFEQTIKTGSRVGQHIYAKLMPDENEDEQSKFYSYAFALGLFAAVGVALKLFYKPFIPSIESNKVASLVYNGPHLVIDDENKLKMALYDFRKFNLGLVQSNACGVLISLAHDINFIYKGDYGGWISNLYGAYCYGEFGLLFARRLRPDENLLKPFNRSFLDHKTGFDVKDCQLTVPFIYSPTNSRRNVQMCFVLTGTANDKKYYPASKIGLILRAFCAQTVTYIEDNEFCATIELPYHYFTKDAPLQKEDFVEKLSEAKNKVNRVLDRLDKLGGLPAGFIRPEEHQDQFQFLIITDPQYFLIQSESDEVKSESGSESNNLDFIEIRGNDAVVDLLKLTTAQCELLKTTINPSTAQKIPHQQSAIEKKVIKEERNFYLHNYYAPLFVAGIRNISKKGNKGLLAQVMPTIDNYIEVNEAAPVWDNAQYNKEDRQYTTVCLETSLPSGLVVESHVYVLIPNKEHHPIFKEFQGLDKLDFSEHLFLCDQYIDKNKGFKLSVQTKNVLGFFKTHDHTNERYLAYAKTWGWREVVVNNRSQQKRVLLIELCLKKCYTHEELSRLSQLTDEMNASQTVYKNSGYQAKTLKAG